MIRGGRAELTMEENNGRIAGDLEVCSPGDGGKEPIIQYFIKRYEWEPLHSPLGKCEKPPHGILVPLTVWAECRVGGVSALPT